MHMKKFCGVLSYLENQDDGLFDLIKSICMSKSFMPKKWASGLTFLYPNEKSIAELVKIAEGEHPEKAVHILESHIIDEYLASPGDFVSKKDKVVNRQFNKLSAEVSGKSASIVSKNGKLEIVPDNEFKQFFMRDGGDDKFKKYYAVYTISGLLDPTDGAHVPKPTKMEKTTKMGKGENSTESCVRQTYACKLEETYKAKLKQGMPCKNPYLEAMVSFMLWCEATKRSDLLKKISKYLGWSAAGSFYIILEPHMFTDNRIVNDTDFLEWHDATFGKTLYSSGQLVQIYENLLNKYAGDPAAVQANLAKTQEMRKKIVSETKPTMSASALATYSDIADAFRDELRLAIFKSDADIDSSRNIADKLHAYTNLLTLVRYISNSIPVKGETQKLCYLNQKHQNLCDVATWMCSIKEFVRSDMFHHILVPSTMLDNPLMGQVMTDDNLMTRDAINISKMEYVMLKKSVQGIKSDESVISNMQAVGDQFLHASK